MARYKSISEAARELYVSQSGVSAALDALEQQLGVPLFIRQRAKGVVLTPTGRAVVAKAKCILDQVESFRSDVAQWEHVLTGELHVGCYAPLAPMLLPPILKAFTEQHPKVSICLQEGDLATIQQLLVDGVIDVILSYDLGLRPDLERRTLAAAPTHVVLSPGHQVADRESLGVEDLANTTMVLLNQPVFRDYVQTLFDTYGAQPNVLYRTGNYQTVCGLVGAGLGVTLLNLKPPVDQTYHGYHLIRRPLKEQLQIPRLVLAYPTRAEPQHIVGAFGRLVLNYLEENAHHYTVT